MLAESIHLRLFFTCSWFSYRQRLWEDSFCKGLKSWKWIPQAQSWIAGSGPKEEEHTRQSTTSNFWNLTNICKISCALRSCTRKQLLFPFHYVSVLQLGRVDRQYNQTSYQHSQESRRLWTSHLLYPPSLTIQSHWSWFLTLHPGCSKASSRARKENKQNGFWIYKSSNNVCWLMRCI